jgi:hypothetical protein
MRLKERFIFVPGRRLVPFANQPGIVPLQCMFFKRRRFVPILSTFLSVASVNIAL